MPRKITNVISLIVNNFDESVKFFESKEADRRNYEFDIKTLFRGFSKDDPKKVSCINQDPELNIHKFFQVNTEWIKNYKVDFSTMYESSWI